MRKIIIRDDLLPEDEAMVQALYSRSGASVSDHLEKLARTGSGKFMESYYVGYGHKSIGDCGTTTIFFEGVSMLAAKAIQEHPLYNGQESSSRYLDMATRAVFDPVDSAESRAVIDRWMSFYREAQDPVAAHVRARYPRRDGEDAAVYDKAVRACTFDVLRGFLPAGITTQLSLHATLRQASDRLSWLSHHPLTEVRLCAREALEAARGRYPHSFRDEHPEEAAWHELLADGHYFEPPMSFASTLVPRPFASGLFATEIPREWRKRLEQRPPRGELPRWMDQWGTVAFEFLLDFGSWRDLQRQRSGVRQQPLIDGRFGFHGWYLDQLPPDLRERAAILVREQGHSVGDLRRGGCPSVDAQYFLPLGTLVPCRETYTLPALVYIAELRSTKFVHPTLRSVALAMARIAEEVYGIKMHVDDSPDDWDVRRGSQDIVEKGVNK